VTRIPPALLLAVVLGGMLAKADPAETASPREDG
jgi:hypothetical protein